MLGLEREKKLSEKLLKFIQKKSKKKKKIELVIKVY
jgi:hypothetical protein